MCSMNFDKNSISLSVCMFLKYLIYFPGEISAEYKDFMYLYEHCSYFSEYTLLLAFKKAGYDVESTTTHELYSVENHCHWVREGVPFIMYIQMLMPDEQLY